MQNSKTLLKTEREGWQMTQAEFARLLSVPLRSLQNWEAEQDSRVPPASLCTLLLCLRLIRLIEAETRQQGNDALLAVIADFPTIAAGLWRAE